MKITSYDLRDYYKLESRANNVLYKLRRENIVDYTMIRSPKNGNLYSVNCFDSDEAIQTLELRIQQLKTNSFRHQGWHKTVNAYERIIRDIKIIEQSIKDKA